MPRSAPALITLLLATALSPLQGRAQQPVYPSPPYAPPPPAYAPAVPDQPTPGWVPQELAAVGQRATFHTDVTFDRAMLQMAQNFIDSTDEQLHRSVAKLDAISLHTYRFSAPGLYDPAALEAVRGEYGLAGWKHLVTARGKGDPFTAGQTDLWISFAHMNVTGMVVLLSDPKNVNVIAITGNLSPLDLLHLRGHFGIPRFEGDQFVSAPESRSQQEESQARLRRAAPAPAPASGSADYSNGSQTAGAYAPLSKPSAAHPYPSPVYPAQAASSVAEANQTGGAAGPSPNGARQSEPPRASGAPAQNAAPRSEQTVEPGPPPPTPPGR